MFSEKLKKLRDEANISREELAQRLNLSVSAISNYENDIRKPKKDEIWRAIANFFNVSVDYLMDVEELENTPQTIAMDTISAAPITIHTDNSSVNNYTIERPCVLSAKEKNHIKLYRRLNDIGKKNVDDYIMLIAETPKYTDTPIEKTVASIIYYDKPVSAGTGEYMDNDNYIMLDVMETPPSGAEFIVRVCGDSMEPTYRDGDKLFIKPQSSVEVGQIGIFSINGDVYVKERAADGLVSHNKKYPIIKLNEYDNIRCYGLVLGVCKKYR